MFHFKLIKYKDLTALYNHIVWLIFLHQFFLSNFRYTFPMCTLQYSLHYHHHFIHTHAGKWTWRDLPPSLHQPFIKQTSMALIPFNECIFRWRLNKTLHFFFRKKLTGLPTSYVYFFFFATWFSNCIFNESLKCKKNLSFFS